MSYPARRVIRTVFFTALIALACLDGLAQSNVNIRIMAANLNGNSQTYEPFAIRIFQGLKPDVVAIQEFNYSNNTTADIRSMVDTAFGTNFYYFRESSSFQIPNGIISRYPIITNASWPDTVQSQPNRGFAWAQIDLPGTNDLYIVSVHMLTSSSANRALESNNLKALMQANFPANAWIVVAGDFNADPRTEACITTFNGYLTDYPIPVDQNGDSDTSANRNTPHDYVLPSLTFTNFETATVMPSRSFPNGQVFDSRVYTPLTDVAPVQQADSGLAQHMAVMKDFLIPVSGTSSTNPPGIATQPQSQGVATGNPVTFSVSATGTAPLAYQWRFAGTNISGATTNPFVLANAQLTNAGNYSVVITNIAGSVTSSVAVLTVTNATPFISSQPQNQTVLAGQTATFSVTANGTLPLTYQWRLGGTNLSGATTNPFVLASVQGTDAGNYSVVITNIAGSITSSVATLNILFTNPVAFAQWNFNSVPSDTNTTTGSILPSVGNGSASSIGNIAASFVGGDAALDPAPVNDNTAWTTTSYPTNGNVGNNKTAGVQFSVSTAGIQNLVISWSQRSSNTGGKYFRLQYATNGTSFVDFPTAVAVGTGFAAFTNSLALIPGVNNNSNFVFRIVAEFESTAASTANAVYVAAGTSYATAGTTRFDMVTVSGTSIIPNSTPATNAVLSAAVFSAGQFQMLVTGAAGSNYVVQATTNLAPANWVGQFTNASPFSFTDANLTAPQKFYRAIVQP